MIPENSEPPKRPTFVLVSACINLLLVIACLTISGLSIGFARGKDPFGLCGGICLLTLCIPAGVLQYLAVFRSRDDLLDLVGAIQIAVAAFWAFGAVVNLLEPFVKGQAFNLPLIAFVALTLPPVYLLAAGLSALRWSKELSRQVVLSPKCLRCDYDLRGTLAAGITRCPECGWSSKNIPQPWTPDSDTRER